MLREDIPKWLLEKAACWKMEPADDGVRYFESPDGIGFFGWPEDVVDQHSDFFPRA